MTTTIEKMEARRRTLDSKIRAAKRSAEAKERQALLSARHTLGVWLADFVGADTIADVARLREVLGSHEIQEHLVSRLASDPSDTSAHDDDASASESSDNYGAHP